MAEARSETRRARDDFLEEAAFAEEFDALTAEGQTRELKRLLSSFLDAADTIGKVTDTLRDLLPEGTPKAVLDHLALLELQARTIADGSRTAYADLREIQDHMAEVVLSDTLTLTENEHLVVKATRDGLTGAYNRRYFDERFAQMVAEAQKSGRPLAVMFVDADHFKRVNDTYGHASGDAVLQVLARTLQLKSKKSDLVARYGGEEFVIVMQSSPASALKAAERLRMAVREREAFEADGIKVPAIRVSIGVAHLCAGDTPETFLKRADEGVYKAKEAGRDRVVVTPSPVLRRRAVAELAQ